MTVAEWILVAFLSVALLVFLIVGIVLIVKLMAVADEAKKIIITSQGIAEKTDDIVDNLKDMTSIGGVVKTFTKQYTKNKHNNK